MFVKMCFRLTLKTNLHLKKINCSKICSSNFLNRVLFRNVCDSVNIFRRPQNSEFSVRFFTEYLLKNNNFKHPVSEILSLNFAPDTHESFKLLNQLKEIPQDENLREETLRCLNSELNKFTTEDILKVIVLASNIPIPVKDKFFEDLFLSLDKELKTRKVSLNESLEIFFVLRHTSLGRHSLKKFHFYLKSHRLISKLNALESLQVIHLFYHFEKLNAEKSYYNYYIIKYIKENLSKFNMCEMGIILATLVRAEVHKTDIELIDALTNKVLNEINTADSLCLYYTFMFLLKCSSIKLHDLIIDFQEKLSKVICKFNSKVLVMSLLSGYPYSLSSSLWDTVLETLKPHIKLLELHDIERMARVTTMFNVNDEEFLQLAVEAVDEKENLDKYFPHFVHFCKHLAIHRIYPKKFLNILFSKSFVADMISRNFLKEINDWLFINYCLQIDKPEYQCTSLDEFSKKKLHKKLFVYMPFDKPILNFYKDKRDLFESLEKFYGKDKLLAIHCLPHFEKGAVMKFNKNLEALPVPKELKKVPKEAFVKPVDDKIWVCINVLKVMEEKLSPMQEIYRRHLIAIGYEPILVPLNKFCGKEGKKMERRKEPLINLVQRELEKTLKEKQKQNYIRSN